MDSSRQARWRINLRNAERERRGEPFQARDRELADLTFWKVSFDLFQLLVAQGAENVCGQQELDVDMFGQD
jgi:hypothetical protein